MREIKCGIIGCGVIAPTHVESYQKIEGVIVKSACDLIPERREKLAEKYQIPVMTAEYMDILNDPEIDLVSVCTDHFSHAQIVVDALDHGKHVICEKCLTSSNEGIDAMLEAHKRHPELIFSGIFQHRYEPTNRVLRKLIQDGAFGKPLMASLYVSCLRTDEYYNTDAWRGTWAQEGGSLLINQCIHHFDILRFIMGDVVALNANFDNLVHQGVIETEDVITIQLKFASGALGTVVATSGSKSATWKCGYIVTGTEGFIEYTDFQPGFMSFTDDARKKEVEESFANCKLDEALQVAKVYYGGGHPAQIADVVDALRSGREPYVTGEEAARTARLVMACYESGKTGKWVSIEN